MYIYRYPCALFPLPFLQLCACANTLTKRRLQDGRLLSQVLLAVDSAGHTMVPALISRLCAVLTGNLLLQLAATRDD